MIQSTEPYTASSAPQTDSSVKPMPELKYVCTGSQVRAWVILGALAGMVVVLMMKGAR